LATPENKCYVKVRNSQYSQSELELTACTMTERAVILSFLAREGWKWIVSLSVLQNQQGNRELQPGRCSHQAAMAGSPTMRLLLIGAMVSSVM
jgi:hypothetical protein